MNYQYSQTYPVDNHEHYNQTSTNQLTQLFNKTPSTPLSSEDLISTVNNNNNSTSNPFPLPMDQNALLTQMYPQYNNNPYSKHNYYAQSFNNNPYLYNTQSLPNNNPNVSDESLMKLPHLRKYHTYIRQMNNTKTPIDYNDTSNGRTANIQNLHTKNTNTKNLNLNLNANNKRKNKRNLFKTELCANWIRTGHCSYGKKCKFAHGSDDIRDTRLRIENYKTQPCCDPAQPNSRLCLFGKRCNYAHPGEPLRRSHHCMYLDKEYNAQILKDYGSETPYPFGIYM